MGSSVVRSSHLSGSAPLGQPFYDARRLVILVFDCLVCGSMRNSGLATACCLIPEDTPVSGFGYGVSKRPSEHHAWRLKAKTPRLNVAARPHPAPSMLRITLGGGVLAFMNIAGSRAQGRWV